MTSIIFRAKQKNSGEWISGSAIYHSNRDYWLIVDDDTATDQFGTGSYSIQYETAGQYVGIKDVNAKFIYEGDIVKIPNCKTLGRIIYSVPECRFEIEMLNGDTFMIHEYASDIEIVGNIYDNLYLLKADFSRGADNEQNVE